MLTKRRRDDVSVKRERREDYEDYDYDEDYVDPPVPTKKRIIRVQTSYSDEEKEQIIEFLKANPSIYEKRRANFKKTALKDKLWQEQADKMETTVEELKTWYHSQRTKLGRLKHQSKTDEGVEGFSETNQWLWESMQFIVPHIVETVRSKHRYSNQHARVTPEVDQSSSDAEGAVFIPESALASLPAETTRLLAPAMPTLAPAPTIPAPAPVQDDSSAIGTIFREFLAEKSPSTSSTTPIAGSSFFARYVDSILKQLSGPLRREAEHRIQLVLHDVQEKAEQQQQQQTPSQDITYTMNF